MAEENQDFSNPLETPLTPAPEQQGASRTKNRPATGARQVSPDEVFAQDFQGTATAGDFLGLDLEFIGASHGGGGELDLTNAPQTGAAATDLGDYAIPDTGAIEEDMEPLPAGMESELSDLPPDETADGFADFESGTALAPAPGSRTKLLVGVGALLVVAGAAAYFFVPFGGKSVSVADVGEVAKRPARPERAPKAAPVESAPVEPRVPQPVEDAATPVADPIASVDPSSDGEDVGTFSLGRSLGEIFGEPTTAEATEVDPVADATASVASVLGVVGPDPANAAFPDFSEGYEWVSEDMLDMVWRGTEIPVEAIFAPARTLMPRVGMVRLFMKSGEVFEGRVYAVGQNLIWLETAPGRVGLDGASLDRYEHLAIEAALGIEGTAPLGETVRVRVPGGFLHGRVLTRDGGLTTVVTDDGGKITIADASVEPLQTTRAKVLKY